MPLPEIKTAKELGFKEGDRFRAVSDECWFPIDTVVTLSRDDGSTCPWFTNSDGEVNPCYFEELEPVSDTSTKPRRPKNGDKLRILKWFNGYGDLDPSKHRSIVTVIDDSVSVPLVKGDSGNSFGLSLDGKDEWEYVKEGTSTITIAGGDEIQLDCINIKHDHPYCVSTESQKPYTLSKGGSLMSKLSLLAKKVFDKDTKTLIKAGVLDTDLNVENAQFVLSFVVEQYKKELAALAQEQIDEAKAEK